MPQRIASGTVRLSFCSPRILIVPELGSVTPPRIFINVLLPAPFSPISADDLAGRDGKADIAKRPYAGIGFRDADQFEDGFRHASSLVCGGESRVLILVDAGDFGNDVSDGGFRYRPPAHGPVVAGRAGRGLPAVICRHFPWRALSSAQNESTLDGSMILVGTMISLLAGMKDLSPSRYLAMSFMP